MRVKENSTRQRVAHLMSLDTRFRDDDRYLILKVWEMDGLILTKEQRAVYMSTASPDIICRRRREFSKVFPPSADVLERRYSHYKVLTDEFSNQSWIQRILKRRKIV